MPKGVYDRSLKLTPEQKAEKRRARQAAYYISNREKILASIAAYDAVNRNNKRVYDAAYRSDNLDKIKSQQAVYRSENQEKIRSINAAYRAAHPEKNAAYHAANREKIKAQRAARYAANRTQENAYSKAYRESHREEIAAWQAAYNAACPDIGRRSAAKRRALKRGVKIGDAVLIAVWEKSWRSRKTVVCHWCRRRTSTKTCHVDHIVPLSRGGEHSVDNLCVACSKCNLKKHAKLPEAWNKTLKQPLLFI